jgi:ribosomal protein S1
MENFLTWDDIKNSLNAGDIVDGVIIRHEAYGAFVELGLGFEGLIQITDFKDEGRMTVDQYPDVGERITTVVLGFKESGNQIWLGMKPSQIAKARHVAQ